jgi:hypothetical protein
VPSRAYDWKAAAAKEISERRERLMQRGDQLNRVLERADKRFEAVKREIIELERSAKVLGIPFDDVAEAVAPRLRRGAPQERGEKAFKDVALSALAYVFPASLRAKQIQEHVQKELDREFHPKTAGMTLYRLSQDNLVRREEADWFFVPEDERPDRSRSIERRLNGLSD